MSFHHRDVQVIFGGMDNIRLNFIKQVVDEEWNDLKKRHLQVIESHIYARTTGTGTLRNARDYFVNSSAGNLNVTATLRHPNYERFLDMRRAFVAKRKPDKPDLRKRKGSRRIHNAMIFGKIDPISFRLMNELGMQISDVARRSFTERTITIQP